MNMINDASPIAIQPDHHTIIRKDCLRNLTGIGQSRVRHQMPRGAMNRNGDFRPDQTIHFDHITA